MKYLASLLMMLGGVVLFWPNELVGPVPPSPTDPLSIVYRQDRIDKVTVLREMAGKTFATDPEQAEWHNTQIHTKALAAYQTYVDAVAEAIVAGKVKELADQLEKAK